MKGVIPPVIFFALLMRRISNFPHFFFLKESNMRENRFQANLKRELAEMFPGCFVFKLDPNDFQGIPDLLVIYKDKWAILECKRAPKANRQSNQGYYVDLFDRMSFARFIYPENKEEVLYELQRAFES